MTTEQSVPERCTSTVDMFGRVLRCHRQPHYGERGLHRATAVASATRADDQPGTAGIPREADITLEWSVA